MKKQATIQEFKVTLRVLCEVESSGKPYLTESRVTRQIQKFLSGRSITEGIPCHGESTINVTDCIEEELGLILHDLCIAELTALSLYEGENYVSTIGKSTKTRNGICS